jgi:glutathione synthase/RimK-type ligase-like ATP-grasp enzyme
VNSTGVLIISDDSDRHIGGVAGALSSLGVPVWLFNTAEFPLHVKLSLSLAADFERSLLLLPGGDWLESSRVRSVWYRKPHPHVFPQRLPAGQKAFARAESREACKSLYDALPCLWVSHPSAITAAENKARQLRLARTIGFSIPRTLITNDPDAVRAFFDECRESVVYKALSRAYLTSEDPDGIGITPISHYVYTSLLRRHHLDDLDSLRLAPGVFQERIEKSYDIRVTVVGDTAFAAALPSRERDEANADWRRRFEDGARWHSHKLPKDVDARCRALTRRLGLNYGSVDLILTHRNQYVFLEINPTGEYGWLEAQAGLPISLALADMLAKGKRARRRRSEYFSRR